jgi:hypothetical protein
VPAKTYGRNSPSDAMGECFEVQDRAMETEIRSVALKQLTMRLCLVHDGVNDGLIV